MSEWPATKARRVLAALERIGWRIVRTSGSHRTMRREGWPQYRFAYHEKEELGPVALSEIAKHTGLRRKICKGYWAYSLIEDTSGYEYEYQGDREEVEAPCAEEAVDSRGAHRRRAGASHCLDPWRER
jgi:predicted RNA binding protein YcfA (HicA-like mRNA interferase family)